MQGTKKADNNADDDGSTELAAHIAGGHLLDLTGKPVETRLRDLFSDDIADNITEWHRTTFDHGRYMGHDGKPDLDPYVADLLAIPVTGVIAEALADLGVTPPTRAQCREWAEADRADGGNGTDPEVELDRVRLTFDQDIYAATTGSAEKRINGVPESIYAALDPEAQRKVNDGKVIPGPHAPAYAARWLVRHRLLTRVPVPGRRRPYRAWARTLVRIDQTWYSYRRGRWAVRADPEWMYGELSRILTDTWFIKMRRPDNPVYELKAWNPDPRNLAAVEAALAGLLRVEGGTAARELKDHYGHLANAYPETGTWALCRNGVLDVTTGRVRRNTPLWFSMTQIDADYRHAADPYADTRWLAALRAQWPDDPGAITCLQQWFGYVLSGRTDLQRLMWVFGKKGSGKSLIATVLEALMGNAAVELGLDALNSHFGLESAYTSGAALAVITDSRFTSRDTSMAVGRLLALTSGGMDTLEVARKHKASVSARLAVRLHGTSNDLPNLSDHSGALADRMLTLETSRIFRNTPDEDLDLPRHILTNELGAVLRWAVEGLALLNAAGGKFTRTVRADELDDEVSGDMSNVRQFVSECCELGDPTPITGDFVDLRELFTTVWPRWAFDNNTGKGMSQNAFRRALRSSPLAVSVGQKRMPGDASGKWMVVWGVKTARYGGAAVRPNPAARYEPTGDPWDAARNPD